MNNIKMTKDDHSLCLHNLEKEKEKEREGERKRERERERKTDDRQELGC